MHRLLLLAALCLLIAGCASDPPYDYLIGGIDRPIPQNAVYLGRSHWTGKVLFADEPKAVPSPAGK